MSDLLKEQISALADGELSGDETELLLKRLQTDNELRKTWESYHLTGDAMRQGLATVHDRNFADKVMKAIEPDSGYVSAITLVADRLQGLLKPVAGLAIAATVATVAILSVQSQTVVPPSEVVPSNVTASTSNVDYRLAQPVNWNLTEQDEVKEKLNSYLINHNIRSGSRTFQGMNPYVHIAAYDNRVAEPDEEIASDDTPELAE